MLREFEALTRLRHPTVVSVHEFANTPDGVPYLVMEYVPGFPADQVLARDDGRRSTHSRSASRTDSRHSTPQESCMAI